jgi:hypothetical protein
MPAMATGAGEPQAQAAQTGIAALVGHWRHSWEEDVGDLQVWRPAEGFAFPLSRRGRKTLQISAAGEVVSGVPGPSDRQQWSSAQLTPLGMNRFRFDAGANPGGAAPVGAAPAGGAVIEIIEAGPDLLKLRGI